MSVAPFPFVEELTIARLVGPLSYSRGRTYAANGRVTHLEWNPAAQRLSADVQGTDPRPYRVVALLSGAATARALVRSATCTCPLTINCKHAVAMLLESNSRHRADEAKASPTGAPAGWRGLVSTFEPIVSDAATPRRTLALQFALRAGRARGGKGGRDVRSGRAVRDELATDAASVNGLGVRPVTRGVRGGWIKGDLTWQNVGYQGAAGGFEPAQARWFAQLVTLRNASLGGIADYGSEWIGLDGFESALLWALLDEAQALGIPLVAAGSPGGSPSSASVEIAPSATIGFDARASEGGLELAPRVVIGDASYDAAQTGLIGSHGVYGYEFGAPEGHPTLRLARLSRPATRAERGIIGRPEPVRVEADELPEFLDEHFATLARAVRVTSDDASFTPPALPPATLVLTARYEPGNVLRLDWDWQLADRRRLPLTVPDSAFLDPVAERAPAAAVADILRADPAGAPALSGGELRAALILRGVDAAEFTARVLPAIEDIPHVRIEVIGTKPDYREIVEAPELTVSAVETESNDWFDLGVIVKVEGKTVPFGPLFRALSRGATKLLLVDQSYLSLNQPVFAPLRELIDEAGTLEEWETGLRISKYQTALYAEFEDLADQSEAAVAWRATVDGLRDLTAIEPVPVPPGFTGELRPYQLDGFRWLAFLHAHALGGILADDMGLGKTAQTLALIAHAASDRPAARATGPFLVVAPTSVVSNWAREASRFTPGLRVALITETSGKSGKTLADAAAGADIVLTTYAILRLDAEEFAGHEWSGLVLDEAQFAKNPASKVHEAARGIRAPFRLAVTGTPIENNLTELWALFQIVAPGLFPSAREFAEKYRRPIEVNHNGERLARLRRRVRPFLLRRTKEAVAPELPPKQEQVLEIPLDPRHRRIYDTHLQRERQKILGLVDDLDRNRFIVFRSLTLLRMLSLDAALIDPDGYANVPSAKLDALLEQLDDVVGEGHQALVFSQFTSFLQRAAARLDAAGIPYSYLDGTTRRRGEVIDGFRRGDAPVFLISLKAGGFGLNLTEADYVFLLDPWWNPASEAQAIDRTHRIGQDKQVMVYRLVAEGTIEQKVMALKEKKAALVSAVLDDDAFFSEALSADDIRGLLET
ncbi:DEAD/DEAH box helicase [Microbacterium rhizomatis]|uniref:DEAD/DEAH box helicase n=1 Tax=Microbacterium rhizomatis TaxID=1631477 RepID=A0A5J5J8N2_9MICO|nr:DEAD/DEAH box helicase [Microbacterium rhizomatis]KAA9111534.1 DEAD/DEAH box helicase [Microbacterium rhizomatis]